MIVEIYIIDRIYYNIQELCEINGFNVMEYMSDAIIERYNLDKYGDLNEKLVKKEEKKPSTRRIKKEESVIVTKPVEIVEEKKASIVEKTVENIKPMEIVETVVEEKPKKTRRTLKTK